MATVRSFLQSSFHSCFLFFWFRFLSQNFVFSNVYFFLTPLITHIVLGSLFSQKIFQSFMKIITRRTLPYINPTIYQKTLIFYWLFPIYRSRALGFFWHRFLQFIRSNQYFQWRNSTVSCFHLFFIFTLHKSFPVSETYIFIPVRSSRFSYFPPAQTFKMCKNFHYLYTFPVFLSHNSSDSSKCLVSFFDMYMLYLELLMIYH